MPSSTLRWVVATSTPGITQNSAPAAAADSACSTDQVVPTPTEASEPKRSLSIATSSVVHA